MEVLAYHAVDAAFAGYSGVMAGQVGGHFVLLPTQVVAQALRRVEPAGRAWTRLRAANGQPTFLSRGEEGGDGGEGDGGGAREAADVPCVV